MSGEYFINMVIVLLFDMLSSKGSSCCVSLSVCYKYSVTHCRSSQCCSVKCLQPVTIRNFTDRIWICQALVKVIPCGSMLLHTCVFGTLSELKAEVEKLRAAQMSSQGIEPERVRLFQQEISTLRNKLCQQEREMAEANRSVTLSL